MIKRNLCLLVVALAMASVAAQASPQYQMMMEQSGAYLGVKIRDVTSEDVQALKLQGEAGVYIEAITEGSPAEEAGLEEKDVITEFAGFPVVGARQFRRLVTETPVDRQVEITLWRNGQSLRKTARLDENPQASGREFRFSMPQIPEFDGDRLRIPDFSDRRGIPGQLSQSRRPRLGINGVGLNDQMAEFLGVSGKEGVLVLEVTADSPAAKAGVRAGDVITAVDGKSVETVSDLSAELRDGTNKLEIIRDKKPQTIEVSIAAPRRGTSSEGESKRL